MYPIQIIIPSIILRVIQKPLIHCAVIATSQKLVVFTLRS